MKHSDFLKRSAIDCFLTPSISPAFAIEEKIKDSFVSKSITSTLPTPTPQRFVFLDIALLILFLVPSEAFKDIALSLAFVSSECL